MYSEAVVSDPSGYGLNSRVVSGLTIGIGYHLSKNWALTVNYVRHWDRYGITEMNWRGDPSGSYAWLSVQYGLRVRYTQHDVQLMAEWRVGWHSLRLMLGYELVHCRLHHDYSIMWMSDGSTYRAANSSLRDHFTSLCLVPGLGFEWSLWTGAKGFFSAHFNRIGVAGGLKSRIGISFSL